MKFEKLILERYGPYEGRTIAFRKDADLHLIIGANEAGKTSALSAIGDLLFGYKSKKEFDFRFDAGSLRLGATIAMNDGSTLVFRRRRGNKNTIIDEADKPLGDDLLQPVIGALKRDTFEKDFGLTAERLRQGGDEMLAASGSLSESLAAGSSGLSALNRLKADLQTEADDIFTARKVASKRFYIAAEDYAEKSKLLREAIVTADAVQKAEAECTEANERQKSLQSEQNEIARMLTRLQRAKNTRGKLRELATLEKELAELPARRAIDETSIGQWQDAIASRNELQKNIGELRKTILANASARQSLNEQPLLLASAAEIGALQRASGAAEQSRDDVPKREQERYTAWSKIVNGAQALGLKSADVLLENIPDRVTLAGVRDILQQSRDRQTQCSNAEEALAKAVERRKQLEQLGEKQGYALDPADLSRTFESFGNIPTDAAALRKQSASLLQDLKTIETRLERLQPPPPPLRDLVRLPLPDAGAVEQARATSVRLANELETIEKQLEEQLSLVDKVERELKNLERGGDVATREDLTAARLHRDKAIEALRVADASVREQAFVVLNGAVAQLDRITDDLLANADRAAMKLALEQERLRSQEALDRAREKKSSVLKEASAAKATWHALWAGLDVDPGPPSAMVSWLNAVHHAIADYDSLSNDKKDMEALREGLNSQKEPLLGFLGKLGVETLEKTPIEQIYNEARQVLSDAEKSWADRRLHEQGLQNAIRDAEEKDAQLAKLSAGNAERDAEWRSAMMVLHCKDSAGLAEANEALRIWDEVLEANAKLTEEDNRLAGIRKRISTFEKQVADLCAKIAPDLSGADAFASVDHLASRLLTARDTSRDSDRLRLEDEQLAQKLKGLEHEHQSSVAVLEAAIAILGLPVVEALPPALEQFVRRDALESTIAGVRRDINGLSDGLSMEDLRAEQATVDADTLESEIMRLGDRMEKLREDEKTAYLAIRDGERALEALLKGRDAAAFAQQKTEAAAELLQLSRRWLVRAAAARLAGQAVERHRQSAQDPVIARTSKLFEQATAGAFEGLGVRFGDNDDLVFRAVRTGGEDVLVEGLSDGSRDQLFLALRLALLEQQRGEPLPFIGDDLLTSFDEARTSQAVELLAEFGKKRQTILFSHHRHVADIARLKLGDRLDLIEL